MNVICSHCRTPFAIGRNETLVALQMMQSESLHHYDAHCPRCRRANQIPRDRLEHSVPDWQEALAELDTAAEPKAAVAKSEPVEAKPAAKPAKELAAKKPAAAAKAKPAEPKAKAPVADKEKPAAKAKATTAEKPATKKPAPAKKK